MSPTITLISLVALLVVAVTLGVHALIAERERRSVLERAGGPAGEEVGILKAGPSASQRLAQWLAAHAPSRLRGGDDTAQQLMHAGFDGEAAPIIYAVLRVGSVLAALVLAMAIAPRKPAGVWLLYVALAVAIGLFAPPSILARLVRSRQEKMRRSIPDSLDLLVVCVEAGISLDAAILRVAREMASLHPVLAGELLIVSRRVNAGMPREQALHGLADRTGVEELKALASNMIQAEKWGTSIATVLRVYAESLRRKRKQAAEKRAALAPIKMLFPLTAFIFPTIFIVILGPAGIQIYHVLLKR